MSVKEYHLCQHTILIHFQACYDDGLNVCLRASEVKPKFDRFLVKKLGGKASVLSEHNEWVRAKNPNKIDIALKYRMTIRRDNGDVTVYKSRPERGENKLPSIFYGNMSQEQDAKMKYGVFFNSGLIVKIVCFDSKLFECIDKNIAEFFAVTNFGTMQDKGFGSFTVKDRTVDISEALKCNYSSPCYVIKTNSSGYFSNSQNDLFDTVKQVYSVMKSGYRNPFYHSYIYMYAHEKYQLNNEKAKMKVSKVSPTLVTSGRIRHQNNQGEKYCYVRAILGLGSTLSYITDIDEYFQKDRYGNTKTNRNGEPIRVKETINITHSDKNISRMASPIFFKIIDSSIFICARRIDDKIFDEEFVFTNSDNYAVEKRNGISLVAIRTPKCFDIDDFLNAFVNFYNDSFLRNNNLPPYTKKYVIEDCKKR